MRVASRFTTRESGEQCVTTSGRSMTQTSSVVSYLAQLLLHSDRAPTSVEVLEKFGLTTSVVGDPKLVLINVLIQDGASTIVVIAKMPESLVSVSHYSTYGVSECEKSQLVALHLYGDLSARWSRNHVDYSHLISLFL